MLPSVAPSAPEATEATEATEAPTMRLDALPRLSPRARDSLISHTRPEPGRYLVVHDGDDERLLRIAPGVIHLGRGWGADVRLDDHAVSRRHAILVNRTRGLRILDDRSANGTFVNGRRITDEELGDGDVIVLGSVVLSYREFT
jgi:pSer/pThr/pTyr-binding forkhead associated (FHA) protein